VDQGLEGIMAKLKTSRYVSGARSSDWLKIKTAANARKVVIAGFTAPRGRVPILVPWYWRSRDGRSWRYIGHVGTGFSHQTLGGVAR
jgi:bifunctional non-homologous end joining protein LigD